MKRIFLALHWLNYDTAVGAVVTSLFITLNLGADVPGIAFLALFIAVLSIYNFDHLLDSQRIKGIAQSERHRYYQENFKTLSIYQLLLLVILLIVSWYVPENIARAGIILAVISLIYFLLLFIILPKSFFLKEVLISIVFVSGLVLAPAVTGPHLPLASDYVLWGEIFLLALTNTFILAWFDYDIDVKEGHISIALLIGKNLIFRLSYILLGVLILLIVISILLFTNLESQIIVIAMSIPLLASLHFSRHFRENELYRIASDAIFIFPIIILF